MILAMRQWVEKGKAPDALIGANCARIQLCLLWLTSSDPKSKTDGAAFSRKFCPYPQVSKYNGPSSFARRLRVACTSLC